jgi:hypothetical protein
MSTAAERTEIAATAKRSAAEWHAAEVAACLRTGTSRPAALYLAGYQCGFHMDWMHLPAIIEALNVTEPWEIAALNEGHADWKADRANLPSGIV